MRTRALGAALIYSVAAAACNGAGGGGATSTGGEPGGGGATSTGGEPGGGGAKGTGGAAGSIGVTATGGSGGGGAAGRGGVSGVGGAGAAGVSGHSGAGGGAAGAAGAHLGGAGGAAGAPSSGGTSGHAGSGGPAGHGGAGVGGAAGVGGSGAIVAASPPMGWNTWNTFECNISESLIEATADAMVSSGMQAAGYQYVNLDDCWMNGRDASGALRWDTTKFPSGIPALASYVHGKGLKLGIYETPNTETCVGIYGGIGAAVAVGSLGHETKDAQTFASWGIDYLKYDLCKGQRSDFATMRDALRATGRAIVYSINPGNGVGDLCPPNSCSLNLVSLANLWRIGFDINASWASVTSLIDQDGTLSAYAGPGHWNDPDILEVGKGLTATEDQSHFSMWAMLAAPLLAGNDLRSMSSATRAVLTNSEVIALDQDLLGQQGRLVATPATNLQIWSKPLSGGDVRGVALFNRTGAAASITVAWSTLGLPAGSAGVRDLWSHTDLGTFAASYTASAIPSHGVVVLKVSSAP